MHNGYSYTIPRMAQTKVLMWLFYDTTLLAWAIGRIPTFIELSTIQGAISTILFTAFVIFRLISLWEDIRKKRLDNKERAHIVEKKISGGIGVVVRREDAELVPSIEFFHDIKNSVDRVFDSTKADRFLILKAENGKTDFKFASVLYEQHKKTDKTKWSIGAAGRYLHFEFDQDYNQRLKEAERSGVVDLIVENLPYGTDFKTIYTSEGVTHSRIYFILRFSVNDQKDEILYCSVATHEGNFSDVEKIIIKQEIDMIRARTKTFAQ